MKKRIQTMIIFAAMICMSISGCNDTTVTPTSTSATEPIVKTSVTSVTTVTTEASITEVTEKFTIPSTVVETTKSVTEVVAVTTFTAPQTETPKVETEKTHTQISTEYYEPTETTIAITTDDTKLTHAEFSTKENMQRLTAELNAHYQKTGMTLDSTLNIENCGWMFAYQGEIDKTSVRSYNEHWVRIVVGMDEQIAALNDMYNVTSFEGIRFHYYAELQADGEYHIYYCYQ